MRVLLLILALCAPAHGADDVDRLLGEGRVAEAVPAAEAAAKARPADLEAQERWIDLMHGLGYSHVVLAHYADRVRAEPASADAQYLLGRAQNDLPASRAAYEAALALQPEHARAHMGLGAVRRVAGDLPGAVAAYQKALELDGGLGEAWGALLSLYVRHGETAEAIGLAQVAMLSVPDLAEPYLVHALLVPEHAEATLRKGMARVTDPRILTALSEHYLDLGRGQEALDLAEDAVRLNPAMPGARLAGMFARSMAAGTLDVEGYRALVSLHDREASEPLAVRAAYDGLVRRYPGCPLPWMSRARVRAQGDIAGARADLEAALALRPEEEEARAALGLLLVTTDPARAATLLSPVATARPHDAALQVAWARAALGSGDTQAAIDRLQQTVIQHPYDIEAHLHLANALSRTGQKDRAWQLLVSAAGRIPDVRITMARAAAARETQRYDEALAIYERLHELTGKPMFAEAADLVRRERATSGR